MGWLEKVWWGGWRKVWWGSRGLRVVHYVVNRGGGVFGVRVGE